ncbi:MAG: DUF2249 domain-containing protein [Gemmatimonadaceae bacterium]|nr:DUF2249 domain-containing protein [Gemmatimonadaceae bacterium]
MTRGARKEGPVLPTDRVSDVLARDERLVEVFVGVSQHFTKLRNAGIRKVMARLATVQQAAQLAGVPLQSLLDALNSALGVASPAATAAPSGDAPVVQSASSDSRSPGAPDATASAGAAEPAWIHERVVDLDVRPALAAGKEPFDTIMATVAKLKPDEVLRLRAPFEPAPLYAVLGKRGFEHHTRRDNPDDWSVWFRRNPEGVAARPAAAATAGSAQQPGAVRAPAAPGSAAAYGVDVVLDVREMEPPEPMVHTLEAAENLEAGQVLLQVNVRVPEFLLPILDQRGFSYTVDRVAADEVHVRIQRS